MFDRRNSALATCVGLAIGVFGMIHGMGPVHAAGSAPHAVSAPARQAGAVGAAANLIYLPAR